MALSFHCRYLPLLSRAVPRRTVIVLAERILLIQFTYSDVASARRSAISSFCNEPVRSNKSPSITAARLCAV